jgi:hypothetical protein
LQPPPSRAADVAAAGIKKERAKEVEPSAVPTNPAEKSQGTENSGAIAALDVLSVPLVEADLIAVIRAWPSLPIELRHAITAIIGSAREPQDQL